LAGVVGWGWIATNPAAASTPRQPERRPRHTIPSPDDVGRIVDATSETNPPLAVFLRLAAASGARRDELCAPRWRDVNLDGAALTIRRSVINTRHQGVIEKDTKTHAERRLSLDAGTVAVLAQHREHLVGILDRFGAELDPASFVFSHEVDGSEPWRPDYTSLSFTRLRDRRGLSGVRLHNLRHFNATALLAAGTDIRTVSGRRSQNSAELRPG